MRRDTWRFCLAVVLPVAVGVWLALLTSGGARTDAVEQPVALLVRPMIMLTRGDVRAQIRVPRDVDNRALVLAWSSDAGTAGESRWPLDGDAPVLYVRELPSQPPAHYLFVASVYGRVGELRGRATASIYTPETTR